ncbi:alpha,alpha-trehalase [Candidatus Saccharibacteria bacterium CPR2]|nr:alpha,alpha-trehalase [Candidatus Saccharibacteria bacterium CPR2]
MVKGISLALGTGKKERLQKLVDYIDAYWGGLVVSNPEDHETLIGLPHPYIVPSTEPVDGFVFREQYYWDTYFVIQGLIGTQYQDLAIGMVNNLLHMLDRFGMIPNANRFYMLSRSQPPLLSSMILDVYSITKDKSWLENAFNSAQKEYHKVWMGQQQPHVRQVFKGLSRYYDVNVLHSLAEAESGWDYTTRFNHRSLDYIPIDLNSLLYKYEVDFSHIASILEKPNTKTFWEECANQRRRNVHEYLWNEEEGFYFEYNYKKNALSAHYSLAAYYAMFAGLASEDQSASMVKKLKLFQTGNGLTATPHHLHPSPLFQWATPNGWAPLQYIVVKGLEKYGYHSKAKEIARGWVKTVSTKFETTGKIYEKYNLLNSDIDAAEGVYPHQSGFAWTNAVTYRLIKDYEQ